MEQYTHQLANELRQVAPKAAEQVFDTVYFGGGTPTILPPTALASLLNTLRSSYTLTQDAEITLECNPATANEHAF
jgi:oxygen-independent coproporphyrinogen-3 oxidase